MLLWRAAWRFARKTDLGEEWFSFLHDVGGQLRAFPVADVLRCVNCAGRNEEHATRLQRDRWLPFHLVLERRPFEDVDDLLTRMCVPGRCHPGLDFDDRLHHLASLDAEIVTLEIDASGSCQLRLRRLKNQTAHDDDRRDYCHSPRLHHASFLRSVTARPSRAEFPIVASCS